MNASGHLESCVFRCVVPPGVGDGLLVRRHRRWEAAQVPERIRRVQPPLPCNPGGQALQGQGRGGCWRSSPASTRPRRSSDRTTGLNSLPMRCASGARTVAPVRLTSSQDPPGRTALLNHSTAASVMNSSTPSCSPRWLKPKVWPIAGADSTTPSGHISPSKGVRPWRAAQLLAA